jgi:hypothetical protein
MPLRPHHSRIMLDIDPRRLLVAAATTASTASTASTATSIVRVHKHHHFHQQRIKKSSICTPFHSMNSNKSLPHGDVSTLHQPVYCLLDHPSHTNNSILYFILSFLLSFFLSIFLPFNQSINRNQSIAINRLQSIRSQIQSQTNTKLGPSPRSDGRSSNEQFAQNTSHGSRKVCFGGIAPFGYRISFQRWNH